MPTQGNGVAMFGSFRSAPLDSRRFGTGTRTGIIEPALREQPRATRWPCGRLAKSPFPFHSLFNGATRSCQYAPTAREYPKSSNR